MILNQPESVPIVETTKKVKKTKKVVKKVSAKKSTAKPVAKKPAAKKPATKKKTTKKKPAAKKRKREDSTKRSRKKEKRLTPKRKIIRAPRSTWISFLSSVREEKRPEHENLSFGALCQLLSPVWQSMTDEQKQPYVETYQRDRQRYQAELLKLNDDDKRVLRAHKRRRRKERVGRPKAALSTYMLFVMNERANVVAQSPDISFQEIGRQLGHRWRSLPDESRAGYVASAKVDRERFDGELKVWKQVRAEDKRKCQEAKAVLAKATAAAKAAAVAAKALKIVPVAV